MRFKFNVATRFKMNGEEARPREALRNLLHPDLLAEKLLQKRVADLACQWHPTECHNLVVCVKGGKVMLQKVCCKPFQQKVLQALNTPQQQPG